MNLFRSIAHKAGLGREVGPQSVEHPAVHHPWIAHCTIPPTTLQSWVQTALSLFLLWEILTEASSIVRPSSKVLKQTTISSNGERFIWGLTFASSFGSNLRQLYPYTPNCCSFTLLSLTHCTVFPRRSWCITCIVTVVFELSQPLSVTKNICLSHWAGLRKTERSCVISRQIGVFRSYC